MKNISIKGIIIGLVALILIDTLGGVALTKVFIGELTSEAVSEIQSDSLFLSLRILVGALALVGAGFIVEIFAKKNNLINSAILGVISTVLTFAVLDDSYPFWYLILSYLYQFPSALLGGNIYYCFANSKQNLTTD